MNRDLDHLKVLFILYYVYGGLHALAMCFVLLPMGIFAMTVGQRGGHMGRAGPTFGLVFLLVCATSVLIGLAISVCSILAGRYLARQRYRTFCFVVACLACTSVPLGTILGVFTITVLMRESVRQIFEEREQAAARPFEEGGYV